MKQFPRTAALALIGWYLMLPPLQSCLAGFSGGSCEPTPLSKWRITATYDDRSKCERFRGIGIEHGKMYLGEMNANSRARTLRMKDDEAVYHTWMMAQCVATDDPRLLEPHPK